MAKTLDKVIKEIQNVKGRATTEHEWPMIVFNNT